MGTCTEVSVRQPRFGCLDADFRQHVRSPGGHRVEGDPRRDPAAAKLGASHRTAHTQVRGGPGFWRDSPR